MAIVLPARRRIIFFVQLRSITSICECLPFFALPNSQSCTARLLERYFSTRIYGLTVRWRRNAHVPQKRYSHAINWKLREYRILWCITTRFICLVPKRRGFSFWVTDTSHVRRLPLAAHSKLEYARYNILYTTTATVWSINLVFTLQRSAKEDIAGPSTLASSFWSVP